MGETAAATRGSAGRWGPLWGARAADWASQEERQRPTYQAALERLDPVAGSAILDVGCGSGAFLALAAAAGAEPHGLDASADLLEVARRRLPDAELRQGEMEALPWDEGRFDVVTGFNSFFFAADMVAALREAARVVRVGAPVVIQVWGRPQRCALEAMKEIARPYAPAPPPEAPPPPKLWQPGVLEEIAARAGLEPGEAFTIEWAYEYPDAETLGRELMSPMGLATLVGPEREPAVREQIVAALEPYRRADGSFRLSNEFRFLIATA